MSAATRSMAHFRETSPIANMSSAAREDGRSSLPLALDQESGPLQAAHECAPRHAGVSPYRPRPEGRLPQPARTALGQANSPVNRSWATRPLRHASLLSVLGAGVCTLDRFTNALVTKHQATGNANLVVNLFKRVWVGSQEGLCRLAALTNRSPSYVNQEPDLSTIWYSTAMSSTEPSLEMPVPYMMSNSADLNGGATLFLTTLTLTRLPTTSPLTLMLSTRLMSRRTDEKNLSARPPPAWSRGYQT